MPALKYWDTVTSTWKTGAVGLPSGQVWQQIIGDGLNTSFVVTHGFSTRAVSVSVYRNSPPYEEVQADVERTDTNSVTVRTYPTVPAVSEYIVAVAAAGTQATLNITIDPWHLVGAAGEPAFGAGASNYGGGEEVLGFRKLPDGTVRLKGTINAPSLNGTIFTLPVGYRPPALVRISIVSAGVAGSAYITSAGVVAISQGGLSGIDLTGVVFDTQSVLQTASVAAQPFDTWHSVGSAGEPPLLNGFTARASEGSLQFRKDAFGKVLLRGVAENVSATIALTIFTLPVGYRPPRNYVRFIGSDGGTGTCYCYVDASGNVVRYTGSVSADLSTIEFDTDTVNAYSTGTFPYLPVTMDPWHSVGAAGEPAFGTGWSNLGGAYNTVAFRKFPDGTVKLRGMLTAAGGVQPNTFVLPVGYRPPKVVLCDTIADGAQSRLDIQPTGEVQRAGGTNGYISLEGIEFDTDTVLQTASVSAQPIDTMHYIGTTGEPAFGAGVSNFTPATEMNAGFRKYPDGRVRLKGIVNSPSGVTTLWTLPVGYRPPRQLRYMVAAGTSDGRPALIQVYTSGVVEFYGSAPYTTVPGWLDLSSVEFDAEVVSSYPSAFVQINAPARVTSLPVSPVDGQEVYYVADATNGVLWHLRYNAASASAYKWEFVGGSPLESSSASNAQTTGGGTFFTTTLTDGTAI